MADAPDFTMPVSIYAQFLERVAVDIVGQSLGNVNVNVADAIVNISSLKFMDAGSIVRADGGGSGVTVLLHTVPAGKRFYMYGMSLSAFSTGTSTTFAAIELEDPDGYVYPIMVVKLAGSGDRADLAVAFTLISVPENWKILLEIPSDVEAYGVVIGVEMTV